MGEGGRSCWVRRLGGPARCTEADDYDFVPCVCNDERMVEVMAELMQKQQQAQHMQAAQQMAQQMAQQQQAHEAAQRQQMEQLVRQQAAAQQARCPTCGTKMGGYPWPGGCKTILDVAVTPLLAYVIGIV